MLRPLILAAMLAAAGLVAEAAEDPAAEVASAAPAGATAASEPAEAEQPLKPPELTQTTVCALIEASARRHRLPVDFFTRLIWKESRFRQNAVSPKGARGIAQFMPGTARLRGLADPFDPIEAIPASALYLRELADRFGNLGLAAAAYNSGERRVTDWRTGSGGLPFETRDYVLAITGLSAEDWNLPEVKVAPVYALPPEERPPETCLGLAALLSKPGAGTERVIAIAKAGWAPWGVQVAGNFSLDRAMASYAALQARHAEIMGASPPLVVRSVNRSRGSAPVFHLRVPAQTREEAGELCGRLKRAGGACMVIRTQP